jgi:hypothetical protein
MQYFETRKSDHVDTYGDKKVADPYQWLEDPGLLLFQILISNFRSWRDEELGQRSSKINNHVHQFDWDQGKYCEAVYNSDRIYHVV